MAPLECEAEGYDKETDIQYHLLIFSAIYEVLSSITEATRKQLLQYFLQHREEVREWELPTACRAHSAEQWLHHECWTGSVHAYVDVQMSVTAWHWHKVAPS